MANAPALTEGSMLSLREAARGPLTDTTMVPTLLTVAQVAQQLQMPKPTIYWYCQTGQLPAIKIGKHWRFDPVEMEAYLKRRRVKPVTR